MSTTTYRMKLSPGELKRRRMWIRAGIPCAIYSIPQDTLLRLCITKDEEAFDAWHHWWCVVSDENPKTFLRELKKLARRLGIKHWLLREWEDEPMTPDLTELG